MWALPNDSLLPNGIWGCPTIPERGRQGYFMPALEKPFAYCASNVLTDFVGAAKSRAQSRNLSCGIRDALRNPLPVPSGFSTRPS